MSTYKWRHDSEERWSLLEHTSLRGAPGVYVWPEVTVADVRADAKRKGVWFARTFDGSVPSSQQFFHDLDAAKRYIETIVKLEAAVR